MNAETARKQRLVTRSVAMPTIWLDEMRAYSIKTHKSLSHLVRSAVYEWAKDEPGLELTEMNFENLIPTFSKRDED